MIENQNAEQQEEQIQIDITDDPIEDSGQAPVAFSERRSNLVTQT
jgi:hypothetical protein